MIKNDRTNNMKDFIARTVAKFCMGNQTDISAQAIKDAIESGEITVEEIGKIFTECLRFAIA